MEAQLEEKTGKSLAAWKQLLATTTLAKHTEIVNFLKQEHGLTHGYANLISLKYREADAGSSSDEQLVADQYAKKADLKPIYDAIVAFAAQLGSDVEVAPKKATVSLRRKRQFALIKPATKSRMDVGLKFDDRAPQGRLLDSGAFGTMCTHRVELTSLDEFDDEIRQLFTEAYQQAD